MKIINLLFIASLITLIIALLTIPFGEYYVNYKIEKEYGIDVKNTEICMKDLKVVGEEGNEILVIGDCNVSRFMEDVDRIAIMKMEEMK